MYRPIKNFLGTLDLCWWVCFGIVIFTIDQATKYFAFNINEFQYSMIPGFFDFMPVINHGIAFGIFSEYFLTKAICFFTVLFLIGLLWVIKFKRKIYKSILPEILILSASLSNLFDRIFYGGVLDFINIKVISGYSFPIGNLADILIVCSVTWLIIDLMFLEKYNARKMLYE